MANNCQTKITIEASADAIKDFALRYERCNHGEYPNTQDTPHIIDEFGAKAELLIDRVGSKWVERFNFENEWEEGATNYKFQLVSAWYPPSDMIKEIYRQLTLIDPNTKMEGSYFDEGFDPVGVFRLIDGEMISFEESLDVDYDNDEYWDDQVEPVFDSLNAQMIRKYGEQ